MTPNDRKFLTGLAIMLVATAPGAASAGWVDRPAGNGWVYDYQDLIAGIFALIAGAAAVIVVLIQIKAEDRRATRHEDTLYEFVIEQLVEEFKRFDVYWRALAISLAHIEAKTGEATLGFEKNCQESLTSDTRLEELSGLLQGLPPHRRARLETVVDNMRRVKRQIERMEENLDRFDDDESRRMWGLRYTRTALSHLNEAARRADLRLSDIFVSRPKSPVDWSTMAEVHHSILDDFEKDHPLPANAQAGPKAAA